MKYWLTFNEINSMLHVPFMSGGINTPADQLSDADLAAAGVTPTLLRISLGLENADDIIEDFEQAFSKID